MQQFPIFMRQLLRPMAILAGDNCWAPHSHHINKRGSFFCFCWFATLKPDQRIDRQSSIFSLLTKSKPLVIQGAGNPTRRCQFSFQYFRVRNLQNNSNISVIKNCKLRHQIQNLESSEITICIRQDCI